MKDLAKLAAFAALLLGGYIAYDQWRSHHDCEVLARRFEANFYSMGFGEVVDEAERVGHQLPVLAIRDRVEDNRKVGNQLDAQCPGWREGKYW